MFRRPAKSLLTVLMVLTGLQVFSQTSTVSNPTNGRENDPYSKYGIGRLQNGNNTVLKGMGNITSAFASPFQVNTDNPASYSFLLRTTFEAGATGSFRSVESSDLTYKTGTASLSYLNVAFPTSRTSAICLGFRPYSRIYYKLQDTILATGLNQTVRLYNGEGAMNYAFIGAAKRFKGLSIGFNFGYLFGNIRTTSASIPIDPVATNYGYNAEFSNYTNLGGIYWKAGAMYEAKLDSFHTLRVGGTVTIGQSITERFSPYQIASFSFGDTTVRDTVYNPGELKGSLKLPLSYSFGVILSRNDKWSLGADYAATNWSGFQSTPDSGMNVSIANSSYKISLGGDYTPDINNISSYFSKVTYRAGVYYGTDYLKFANNTLPYYGATLGCSLPFRRSTSRLHLALDAGSLGTKDNGLMKENYIQFSVGLSFNDLWFVKKRYQ